MTTWEEAIRNLVKPACQVDRYEFRPRLDGVVVFCTTCGSLTSETSATKLSEAVKEAEEHEKHNHSRRNS